MVSWAGLLEAAKFPLLTKVLNNNDHTYNISYSIKTTLREPISKFLKKIGLWSNCFMNFNIKNIIQNSI